VTERKPAEPAAALHLRLFRILHGGPRHG
jgi:hypothetical protein